MNIDDLITDYQSIEVSLKELGKKKEEIRKMLNEAANNVSHENSVDREVKHVFIPKDFLDTEEKALKHLSDNFVTWDITEIFEDEDGFSSFLKRKAEYTKYKYEGGSHVLSRDFAFSTAKINWETLEKESPEIAEKICKKNIVVEKEVNEEEFKKLIDSNPDAMSLLGRHLKESIPSTRITVREKKQ